MNVSIIEKIKKLRMLSQSSNLNEAANASAAAERLIQEHRIAEAELSAGAEDEEPETDYLIEGTIRAITWRGQLITSLAECYSCCAYQTSKTGIEQVVYALVGAPSDLSIVKAQYAFLTLEIVRLSNLAGLVPGKRAKNSFYLGAVYGIRDAMLAANQAARQQASAEYGSALVRLDARLARAEAALPPNLRSSKKTSSIDQNAFGAGKTAGGAIHRGSSLGTGGVKLLGG